MRGLSRSVLLLLLLLFFVKVDGKEEMRCFVDDLISGFGVSHEVDDDVQQDDHDGTENCMRKKYKKFSQLLTAGRSYVR